MAPPKGTSAGPTLLVVESPAKARTLRRMLGRGWDVRATSGHVKDLPAGRLGVDVERGFRPEYEVLKGQGRILSELRRAARTARQVLLATDPDREGEAIAWHVAEDLGAEGGSAHVRRVLLHELTPHAVAAAVESPGALDRRRFEAQQARRILDRLVGFLVSPVLWRRVKRGLSAGRVQSVATRLVVDREQEIEAFAPVESWSVEADLVAGSAPPFRARLEPSGDLWTGSPGLAQAEATLRRLEGARWRVASVTVSERRRGAPPPFTTATLQQEASRRLGFSPKRTMAVAQRLFEGLELGEDGAVGLITYPRTSSVRLAAEAVEAARSFAVQCHGPASVPERPNAFPSRGRGLEPHEAIRPTSLDWPPERVRPFLEAARERDAARLYGLVWRRFLASQMAPAVTERTVADLVAEPDAGAPAHFRAVGGLLRSPGWQAVHGPGPPLDEAGADPVVAIEATPLPAVQAGQALRAVTVSIERQVSASPPRFDEASLVAELEARGVGRPSTYASILETIQARGYVERVEKRLRPTVVGRQVTLELVRGFPRELDPAYTAEIEGRLDDVEAGRAAWQDVVAAFHAALQSGLAALQAPAAEPAPAGPAATGPACPACGRPMVVRSSRHGEFLACTGYPACRRTMEVQRETMPCPRGCGGQVVRRRSARGRPFYGCSTWRRDGGCDFVSWDRPVAERCPTCGSPYLVRRVVPRLGAALACPDRTCGYRRPADEPAGGEAEPDGGPQPA